MVSHMLRMQKVLGSSPSVSNFKQNKHLFSILPISNTSSLWCVPTCVLHGPIKACCSSDGKHGSRPTNLQCWRCPWDGDREASLNLYGRSLNAFPSNHPPSRLEIITSISSSTPILARCPKWKQRRSILFVGGCEMHPPWGSNPRPQG